MMCVCVYLFLRLARFLGHTDDVMRSRRSRPELAFRKSARIRNRCLILIKAIYLICIICGTVWCQGTFLRMRQVYRFLLSILFVSAVTTDIWF